MRRARWPLLVVWFLIVSAAVLRIVAAQRPGLWADEIFSLAMATGHSLEHPAAAADPGLGDFVEPHQPQYSGTFRQYVTSEEPPAGLHRITRAVLMSDTSPPLYYLLLSRWVRGFGAGDTALRLFSVLWAVLALPLLWLLGREVAGERVAWTACLLFSFSPVAIYYSAEGRMHSLLWFLALGLVWLTLRLGSGGVRPTLALLWVGAAAAGLLTHYFFAFLWLACLGWLWLRHPRQLRIRVAGLASLVLLAILPWYLEVPASLARWRITGEWLNGDISFPRALGHPFLLAGSLLSGASFLGGWRWANWLVFALLLLLTLWGIREGRVRRLFSGGALLVWGWLGAICVGPLVFDILRHTTTSEVPRYASSGLPAAMLLLALGISQLVPRAHAVAVTVILLAWLPGIRKTVFPSAPRRWEPYPQVATRLEAWARPDDLVLLRSIPSGIIGVTRYLHREIPVATWINRLGARQVPGDIEELLRGRDRVAVVRIHDFGDPGPLEPWLRAHAHLVARDTFRWSTAEILYFDRAGAVTTVSRSRSQESGK